MRNEGFKNVCFFSIIVLIIDQAIKFYLSSKMSIYQSIVLVKNFLSITYVHNTGAAFSLFRGNTILLIIVGIVAVIALLVYIFNYTHLKDFNIFTYSLLLGGILGNLVDRILHGYVIDYIGLNIFGYHFPIFNFADMCIVISVLLIFLFEVKGDLWNK